MNIKIPISVKWKESNSYIIPCMQHQSMLPSHIGVEIVNEDSLFEIRLKAKENILMYRETVILDDNVIDLKNYAHKLGETDKVELTIKNLGYIKDPLQLNVTVYYTIIKSPIILNVTYTNLCDSEEENMLTDILAKNNIRHMHSVKLLSKEPFNITIEPKFEQKKDYFPTIQMKSNKENLLHVCNLKCKELEMIKENVTLYRLKTEFMGDNDEKYLAWIIRGFM